MKNKKLSLNVKIAVLVCIVVIIYFVFQYFSIRKSEQFKTAIEYLLIENKISSIDQVSLIKYQNTQSFDAENSKKSYFLFEISDGKRIEIHLFYENGAWVLKSIQDK